jgi:DNA-binding CsgD family transcriptional regulator
MIWLRSTSDPELEKKTAEKIKEVQVFEDVMPSVFVIHEVADFSVVYMSKRGLNHLGTTLDKIRLSNSEYHSRYFNIDDALVYVPKIRNLIESNTNETITFFQQVRTSPDHAWQWYLSNLRILLRDTKNEPLLTITLAMPVETMHPLASKVERALDEYSFLQRYQNVYDSLTKRELQILALMGKGVNSLEMAEQLHISEATANTHRRNIRSKINAVTNYDITRFALAFDLI